MLSPMLSPTAVRPPMCPGCAMTLLLCRAYSINHQEFVFHQDHVPLQGPVPGIHPEDVLLYLFHSPILQLSRKLWKNYAEK